MSAPNITSLRRKDAPAAAAARNDAPRDYTAIRSTYIRQLLQDKPWTERREIDDLLVIHKLLQHGVQNLFANLAYTSLRRRYPQETVAIATEIDPALGQRVQREIGAIALSEAPAPQKAARESQERDSWLRAGGRI